jgi:hypothetical protein
MTYLKWVQELAEHVAEGTTLGFSPEQQAEMNDVPVSLIYELLAYFDSGFKGEPPQISVELALHAADHSKGYIKACIKGANL